MYYHLQDTYQAAAAVVVVVVCGAHLSEHSSACDCRPNQENKRQSITQVGVKSY